MRMGDEKCIVPRRAADERGSATVERTPNRSAPYDCGMYAIEVEQEADGRWLAEVPDLAGVLTYGRTRDEAVRKAQALSLRVLAERLENGESLPHVESVFSIVA